MPTAMEASPPPMHEPQAHTARPKGILKNPSYQGGEHSAEPEEHALSVQDSKELTHQNTLQNAGHRRSSSAARRSSASRRHSSAAGLQGEAEDDPEKMKLKWDEANLYLAEQEAGGRMKITEPKTPFQYGNAMEEADEEEDVAIDPRFVDVDEVDMAKRKQAKKARESEIPGLELGDAEDESMGVGSENNRVVQGTLSKESSRDKHVEVNDQDEADRLPGSMTPEEEAKHRQFEDKRKQHYEMRNVRDMLGQDLDDEDEDHPMSEPLPTRGVNGAS